MASEHTPPMSVEEYFELEENNPDTRYEYLDGYVYMMSGGSANHATISGNIHAILRSLLHGGPCRAYNSDMSDMKVRVSEKRYSHPDVIVSCDPRDRGTVDLIQSPRLVVEVLSPGTEAQRPGTESFNVPLIVLLIFAGSIMAGVLGSLVGLGGGVLIVPLLTIAFGLPIYFAIGASIISVIATSSGAATAYVRDHLTNLRVGMFLEIATTTGAITGAFLAGLLTPNLLFVLFGVMLLISALPLLHKIGEELPQRVKNDRLANWLHLSGSYPDRRLGREVAYQVTHTPLGMAMMYVAGIISGLLGIGSGTFKVLAMDTAMRLPMKVSTTTSNFMIGVTAAASAGIYFSRGDVPPLVAAPVALGVLLGAFLGTRLLTHLSNKALRLIFIPVMVVIALEMVLRGLGITPT